MFEVVLLGGAEGDFLEALDVVSSLASDRPQLSFRIHADISTLDQLSLSLLRGAPASVSFRPSPALAACSLGAAMASVAEAPNDAICTILKPREELASNAFEAAAKVFGAEDAPDMAYVEQIVTVAGDRESLPADARALAQAMTGAIPASAFFFRAESLARRPALATCRTPADVFSELARGRLKARRLGQAQLKVHTRRSIRPARLGKSAHEASMTSSRERLAVEHAFYPRFALIENETGQVRLCSDPEDVAHSLTSTELVARMADFMLGRNVDGPLPQYIAIGTRNAWDAIERSRLTPWLLDYCAETLDSATSVSFRLEKSADGAIRVRPSLRITDAGSAIDTSPSIVAITVDHLMLTVLNGEISKLSMLVETGGQPRSTFAVQTPFAEAARPEPVTLPAARAEPPLVTLVRTAVRLRSNLPVLGDGLRQQHAAAAEALRLARTVARDQYHSQPPFPIGPDPHGARGVVFVLPVFSFGGVERVCLRIASSLRRLGYRTTAVVLDKSEIAGASEAVEAFDRLVFLGVGQERGSLWRDEAARTKLIRIGKSADVFVPTHIADIGAVVGQVREAGAAVVSHLHLIGEHADGGPVGHPYIVGEWQDQFDGVLAISKQLVSWAIATGFAANRVLHVPNASSYLFDDELSSGSRRERERRSPSEPLRVLYIGRLDAEKGLARLTTVARHALEAPERLTLRIVGSAVVQGGSTALPTEIQDMVQPPSFDPDIVAAHYAWADVLLIPSFYEGVPLTLLEASLFGVVPVATRVGAIDEVVRSGDNGFLVDAGPGRDVATALIEQIERLAQDRTLLRRMSARQHASESPRAHWDRVSQDVARFFNGLTEDRLTRAEVA